MPHLCTVVTHAERGAPGQRLCWIKMHVALRRCVGNEPTCFHGLSHLVASYKEHTSTAIHGR